MTLETPLHHCLIALCLILLLNLSGTFCASIIDVSSNQVDESTITSSAKGNENELPSESVSSESNQQVDQNVYDSCERCSKLYRSRDIFVKCIYKVENIFDKCDQLLKYKPTFARKDRIRSNFHQLFTKLASLSPPKFNWSRLLASS